MTPRSDTAPSGRYNKQDGIASAMRLKEVLKLSKYDERPRWDDLEETPKKQKKKFNIFDAFYGKERVEDDPGDQDAERNFSFFISTNYRI